MVMSNFDVIVNDLLVGFFLASIDRLSKLLETMDFLRGGSMAVFLSGSRYVAE